MKSRTGFGMSGAAVAIMAGTLLLAAGTARAVTRTWDGGGGDNLASTAENWSDDTRPTSSDHVVLNSTTNKNMTWDFPTSGLPDTVASWTQTEDYTGTVTFQTVYGASGFTNFTVAGNVVIEGGSWTHTANSTVETNRLCVTVNGSLSIGSSGRVDVVARGYAAGTTSSSGPGWTASDRAGGGHGGQGGCNYAGQGRGAIYGSLANPTNLGSGGNAAGGGAGGGAVRLVVTNALVINGTITAAGGSATGSTGGGSGGSIWISAGSLAGSGSGSINADGGKGGWGGGGGAGGRIAVVLSGSDDFGGVTFSALGGDKGTSPDLEEPGAAGTVFLKGANDDYGHLRVNAGARLTSSLTLLTTGTNQFNSITLTNGAVFGATGTAVLDLTNAPTIRTYGGSVPLPGRLILRHGGSAITGLEGLWTNGVMSGAYTLSLVGTNALVWNGNLTLTNGAVLAHERNLGAGLSNSVNLSVQGDLTVATNAAIRVDGQGYRPGSGPGKATANRDGGGHGGTGGRDYDSKGGGAVYGSVTAPANAGSGGSGAIIFSAGGGAVRLVVTNALTVNGMISAAGQTTSQGGGSGGSIWISANSMAGSGSINADGGKGGHDAGGGGGGRIAVVLSGSDNFGGVTFSALGGDRGGTGSSRPGAAGTIYRAGASIPAGAGTVTVNNGSRDSGTTYTALPAFSNSTEIIANTAWSTTNNARIGMTTNTTIASLTLNTGGSLELAGWTLTVKALTVTNRVYKGGVYTPADINRLTDGVGGGKVVVQTGGTVVTFR